MKKYLILHPIFFAIFPLLSFFAYNIRELSLNVIFIPLVTIASFALLLYLPTSFILKDKQKSAILISSFLFLFFSYGHFFNLLEKIAARQKFNLAKHEFLLVLWGLLLISIVYSTIKTRKNLLKLTKILNFISAALVVILLFEILAYQLVKIPWQRRKKTTKEEATTITDFQRKEPFPDIYYIIIDRYASEKALEKYHHYDNSQFITFLENKGFYVAPDSRSNYLTTPPSLASSLNMEYLDEVKNLMGEESDDKTALYKMLSDYKVWHFLKSKGYKFIHFGSTWGPTSHNDNADINYAYARTLFLSEFALKFLKTTAVFPFTSQTNILKNLKITPDLNERYLHRNIALDQFDKLVKVYKVKGPKFVFVHLLITHDPYVFDQDGKFLSEKEAGERSRKENYINQLIFTNKKIKTLIEVLLSKSKIAPIIILQADEGPYSERYKSDINNFDWRKAEKDELELKTAILNAYYLPNKDKSLLYPSITPVNSFRLIFNLYFGENYPLLPDETYAHVDEQHPYKFFNVTEIVKPV